VRVKALSGKPTLVGSLVGIHHGRRCRLDIHRIRQAGGGAKAGSALVNRGCMGNSATTSREAGSEVELGFAFESGVGRQRGVPLVGESAGVEGLQAEAREEEPLARRVEVDTEKELSDLLVYGEGRDSEWDAWVGLVAETVGVRRELSPVRRNRLSAFSEAGDSPKREQVGRRSSGCEGTWR